MGTMWIILLALGIEELFFVIACRIFTEKALHSRKRKPICEICAWGIQFSIFNSLTYILIDQALMNLLVFNISFFAVVVYLYEDKLRYCIYVTIFVYITGMCSEVLAYYLLLGLSFYKENFVPKSAQMFVGAVISKIIWFCLTKIALLFIRKNRERGVYIRDLLEACFVPIGSIIIFFMLIPTESELYPVSDSPVTMEGCLGTAILLTINITTYYLYEKGKKATEKRMREEALQEQCNYYMRQCEESKMLWMELSKFRHDIKQKYSYVQALLDTNRYEELRQYYQDNMKFIMTKRSLADTGNIFFDSILNYKAEIADRDHIHFQLALEIPYDCQVDGEEISICLGNLLDNAIEAVREVEQDRRQIDVKIKVQGHNLYIAIQNPYALPRIQRGKEYITTKQNVRSHGWGLQIVREIVEQYHGKIEITDVQNVFCIRVLLYQVIK